MADGEEEDDVQEVAVSAAPSPVSSAGYMDPAGEMRFVLGNRGTRIAEGAGAGSGAQERWIQIALTGEEEGSEERKGEGNTFRVDAANGVNTFSMVGIWYTSGADLCMQARRAMDAEDGKELADPLGPGAAGQGRGIDSMWVVEGWKAEDGMSALIKAPGAWDGAAGERDMWEKVAPLTAATPGFENYFTDADGYAVDEVGDDAGGDDDDDEELEDQSRAGQLDAGHLTDTDDEMDGDFSAQEDRFGKLAYLEACERLGLSPMSQALKFCETPDLVVNHYGMRTAGMHAFKYFVELNGTIQSLRVSDNSIRDEGFEILCNALSKSTSIVELECSANEITRMPKSIGSLMGKSSIIRTLVLSQNLLGDSQAGEIAKAMRGNKSITVLDLSRNHFTERAGPHLSDLLENNNHLEELNLSWNSLGGNGGIHLSAGVGANSGLQVLDLSWNGLGNDGCAALFAALTPPDGSSKLTELIINNNNMNSLIGDLVPTMIAKNEFLANLEMEGSDLGEAIEEKILAALEQNLGIVQIKLQGGQKRSGLNNIVITHSGEAEEVPPGPRPKIAAILAERIAEQEQRILQARMG